MNKHILKRKKKVSRGTNICENAIAINKKSDIQNPALTRERTTPVTVRILYDLLHYFTFI